MPPHTRKRKASATEIDGDEDAVPKKSTRAPRKTTTNATNRRKGKHATSECSDSSKKKRKPVARDAKSQIRKQGDDLIKFIDEVKTGIPRVDVGVLMNELSPDLTSVLPWMSSSPVLQKNTRSHPQLMLKALDDLQEHVEAYNSLVKHDLGIKAPNWMRWGKDAKDLEEMNKHGLKMASEIVNHMIMPDLHRLPTKPPSATGLEDVAWDLIEEAMPDESDNTWGKIAQGHLKAFTEVSRLLPTDE
ncbi:hypothetical protein KAF25_006390 [Fusarium avenaceum]|uniref:Uncharacterized protein n=1 Tax=Fusarium avenaceum TaxID=40199 RepID=A0A9P7HDT4_9HYPO|nr:hypothetical protein KAF25_006390 [Fusarium avenaceum]